MLRESTLSTAIFFQKMQALYHTGSHLARKREDYAIARILQRKAAEAHFLASETMRLAVRLQRRRLLGY